MTLSIILNKTQHSILAEHCFAEYHLSRESLILNATYKPSFYSVIMLGVVAPPRQARMLRKYA
jgi:hypothetical protein